MNRVKGFDGVRALALIAVFFQHYTIVGRTWSTGGYGVWTFFVLSGFLIVRILEAERRRVEAGETSPGSAIGRFFWRRTLRIWPIYYLTLLAFTLFQAIHWATDFTWPAAGWHALYLSNIYFADVAGRWVGRFGHFWSLAIEEQFYLLAAPALLLTPARHARRLCLCVAVAAAVWDLWLRASSASDMEVYANSLTNFGALALGGWMGLGLPRQAKAGTESWMIAGAIAAVFGVAVFFHVTLYTPTVGQLVAMGPLWCTAICAAVLLRAIHRNQDSLAVKVLEWGPIRGFGKVSYGFYLYHNLVPRFLIAGEAHRFGLSWHVPVPVETAFSFLVALVLASLSWWLIERPLLAFKDRPPNLARLVARFRPRGLAPAEP
jgi:peptidoglycan/LPS O-acetylase OafA/YrhL